VARKLGASLFSLRPTGKRGVPFAVNRGLGRFLAEGQSDEEFAEKGRRLGSWGNR
jgi:hypothetical protein